MITVGVGVEPPLLADLLRRLLWAPGRQVQVHRIPPAPDAEPSDVAVTSSSFHGVVAAPVQIRLPDDDGLGGWGTMIVGDLSAIVPIRSVDDLLALVERGQAGWF